MTVPPAQSPSQPEQRAHESNPAPRPPAMPEQFGSQRQTAQPAPVQGITTKQFKDAFGKTSATLGNPLRSVLTALASYGGGLVVAAVCLVLASLPVMFGLASEMPTGSLGGAVDGAGGFDAGSLQGILFLIGMPAQIVSMAFFGSFAGRLKMTMDDSSFGSAAAQGTVEGWFLPLTVLATVLTIAFIGGRKVAKRDPNLSVAHMWIHAALGGFAVAVVSSLVTFVTAFRMGESEASASYSLSVHAAGFLPFLALLVLLTCAIALGRMTARPFPAWWPRVSEYIDGFKLAILHAVLYSVLACVLVFIIQLARTIIDGGDLGEFFGATVTVLALLPLLAGQVLATLGGYGTLSSAGLRGSMGLDSIFGSGSIAKYYSVLDLGEWWLTLFAVILTLVCVLVVSVVWSPARMRVPGDLLATVTSWAALPVAYFILGIGAIVAAHMGMAMSASGSEEIIGYLDFDGNGHGSFGLAAWTPVLAAVFGIVIELLARFAAPFVAPYFPAHLGAFVHKQAAVAYPGGAGAPHGDGAHAAGAPGSEESTPTEPLPQTAETGEPYQDAYTIAASAEQRPKQDGACMPAEPMPSGASTAPRPEPVGASTAPSSESVGASAAVPLASAGVATAPAPAQQGAQPTPMSPSAKRKIAIGGAIVGGLALFAIVGAIVVSVLSSTLFSPKNEVEAYMSALQEGRFGDAAEAAPPNIPTANRALMTNEVGKATKNRVESYTIGKVEVNDDVASVPVTFSVDGVKQEATYTVKKTGSQFVLFPDWTMETPEYKTIELSGGSPNMAFDVNGVTVDTSKAKVPTSGPHTEAYEGVPFTAFPGTYDVTFKAESEYLDANKATVTVPGEKEADVNQEGAFYPTLNAKGEEQITTMAKKKVDECFKGQTGPELTGNPCEGFSATPYSMVEGSKGTWKVKSYPELTVEPNEEGWYFSTQENGEATFSYMSETFMDEQEKQEETSYLSVSGFAYIDDKNELKVEYEENSSGW